MFAIPGVALWLRQGSSSPPDFSSIRRVDNTPQRVTAASDYQYLGSLHFYYTG